MKKLYPIFTAAISIVLISSSTGFATNGYQLIGIGSYQKSLAGAVTALPGSNMTAVTNPAGMIRIGHRADFSMEAFMPERDTDFSAFGGNSLESESKIYGIPSIGWNGPVGDRDDLVFGGGMYGTSGMGVDYSPVLMAPAYPPVTTNPVYFDGYSSIAFWQMAPALAWQVTEKLSLGASFNIDFQQVAFRQRIMEDTDTVPDQRGDTVLMNFDLGRSASSFGFGISLGALYNINDMVTVGASYKSKQFFSELEYQLADGDMTPFGGSPLPAGKYSLELDFPQQAAIGVAVHVTPALSVAADVKWIEWSDTMGKLAVKGPGTVTRMDPGWDDQFVYAVGLAFKVNDHFNLRIGFNYGESPIDETNAASNLILPAVTETHYTAGADFKFNDHWDIGFHYMYVPENDVTAITGEKISLSEQSVGMNLGYRF
jgi:long-chain fatty acid transport protein